MVIALFMMSTAAMLAYALVTMIKSVRQEERGSREEIQTMYVCEAGVGAAIAELNSGGDGVIGNVQAPISFGAASYYVSATDLGSGLISLVATGTDARTETSLQVVVRPQSSSLFSWAAFGEDGLTMDSNAMVDSYDSALGLYSDQDVNGSGSDRYALANGDVGSNGDITVKSNSWVHGDASPGTGGSISILGSNAGVDGSTLPLPADVILPPIVVPVFPSLGAFTWTASSGSIGPGDLTYTDFHVDGNSTLTILGPATVVVDNFNLDSNAEIVVDATGGPVIFYVINDFLVNSNTTIASTTYTPADVQFNLLSDNIIDPSVVVDLDDVAFDSNAEIYGTIYAPAAHIEINSNFELYGSLVAKSVHLDSNSKVHFDQALMGVGATGASATYETLCWLVLPKN